MSAGPKWRILWQGCVWQHWPHWLPITILPAVLSRVAWLHQGSHALSMDILFMQLLQNVLLHPLALFPSVIWLICEERSWPSYTLPRAQSVKTSMPDNLLSTGGSCQMWKSLFEQICHPKLLAKKGFNLMPRSHKDQSTRCSKWRRVKARINVWTTCSFLVSRMSVAKHIGWHNLGNEIYHLYFSIWDFNPHLLLIP